MDLISHFRKMLTIGWTEDFQKTIFEFSTPSKLLRATSRAKINDDLLTNICPRELHALRVSPSGNILAACGTAIHNKFVKDGETRELKQPISFESSQFHKLPPELLRHIRGYLDAPSASIFSICSMQMYTLIGMSPPKGLQDKVVVGDLLAHDLPDKIACSSCLRFHDIHYAKDYMASSYLESCRSILLDIPCVTDNFERIESPFLSIGKEFNAVLFKMAVKLYHQNRDDTEILKLMSPKEDVQRIAGYPRVSETKCLIVEGCLMQRHQTVLISPNSSKWDTSGLHDPQIIICPHFQAKQSHIGLRIIEFHPVNPQDHHNMLLSWSFTKSFVLSSAGTGVRSCRYCKTDFRIDLKDCPRVGQALFFARWKDLGVWPDREDYLRHVKRDGSFPPISDSRNGEVAAMFEGGAEYEFDSMMSVENEIQLYNKQRKSLEDQREFAS